jgi:hypothetical protein
MSTDPWERTCQRCGRNFEVGLWCREVAYCDACKAELEAMPAQSLDDSLCKHEDWPKVDTPGQAERKSDPQKNGGARSQD